MASNRIFQDGYHLSVVCTHPTTPVAGDPVRYGNLTGVALTAESEGGNATGYTSVDFGPSVWDLSVKGIDDSGNSAVAVGDAIFYVDADTPKLSKKSSGYFFGFALETVTSGATDTINVVHAPSPGSGTLGTGTVGTTNLAAGAVTAAKLGTTLGTGFYPLKLEDFRLISSNDIAAKNATDGGLLSVDTDPKLKRINTSTDKKLMIEWAAGSVIEITQDFPYPPDLDDTAAVVVNFLAYMGGATDTPTLTVGYFENVGDTNAGGATAALSSSVAQKSRTIAASDIGAYPAAASVTVAPGTHATDACRIIGAWITYTRK